MAAEMVTKVVLSTKKEVLLRDFKIKHQELAVQACAKRAGDNTMVLGTLMQGELLKLLVVQIDGAPVKPSDLENLDGVFSYAEYAQLCKALSQIMDGDNMGNFQIEVVSSGSK